MSGGKMPVAKTTFMRDIVYLQRFLRRKTHGAPPPETLAARDLLRLGRGERYVVRLAAAASADFDVTVAAGPSKSRELFRRLPAGVKAFELADLVPSIAPWSDLKAIRRLRNLIDEERFDLVHANSSKAGMVGALAGAPLARASSRHLYRARLGLLGKALAPLPFWRCSWSEKLAARFRAATIVLTSAERDVALAKGLSRPERLRLIPLGNRSRRDRLPRS